MSVLKAVLTELRVEKVTLAEEIKTKSPELHKETIELIKRQKKKKE